MTAQNVRHVTLFYLKNGWSYDVATNTSCDGTTAMYPASFIPCRGDRNEKGSPPQEGVFNRKNASIPRNE